MYWTEGGLRGQSNRSFLYHVCCCCRPKVYANYLRFFLTLQHILFTVLLFSYVSHMWNSPKRFNSGEESLRANGTALLNHVNFETRGHSPDRGPTQLGL